MRYPVSRNKSFAERLIYKIRIKVNRLGEGGARKTSWKVTPRFFPY